jgi:hypothetical protein
MWRVCTAACLRLRALQRTLAGQLLLAHSDAVSLYSTADVDATAQQ